MADVRHNGWREVSRTFLSLSQMVVLNASDNDIEIVADGERIFRRVHKFVLTLANLYGDLQVNV